ncbi:MAG: c-type cytochrome, partial [Myxococcota bacterium]
MQRTLAGFVLATLAAACSAGEENDQQAERAVSRRRTESRQQAQLAKLGEQVYMSNCTACHAQDPGQPGPVGPAVAGASLELLDAKVLRNTYPPGYTPKRDSQAMMPLVHLAPELPALAAFLAKQGAPAGREPRSNVPRSEAQP